MPITEQGHKIIGRALLLIVIILILISGTIHINNRLARGCEKAFSILPDMKECYCYNKEGKLSAYLGFQCKDCAVLCAEYWRQRE